MRNSIPKNKQRSLRDQDRLQLTFSLLKKYGQRTKEDNQILAFLFQKHPFIHTLNQIGNVNLHDEYMPYLIFTEVEQQNQVISLGEQGNLCYCIINGQINIEKQCFGLEALNGQEYTQNIYTLETSRFVGISKEDYLGVITTSRMQNSSIQIDFFKQSYLFGKLSKRTIASILHQFQLVLFRKGQYIYREGDLSDYVYIIKEGEVELSKQFSVLNKNKNLPTTTIGRLEIFGDFDCLLNLNRQFTVKCKINSVCYKIQNQNFYNIIQSNPHSGIENYVNNLMKTQTLSRYDRLNTTSSVLSMNSSLLFGINNNDQIKQNEQVKQNNWFMEKTHSRYAPIYCNSNRKKIRVRYATLHQQKAAIDRLASCSQDSGTRRDNYNVFKDKLFTEVEIPDLIKRKFQHQLQDILKSSNRKQLIIRTKNNFSQIITHS